MTQEGLTAALHKSRLALVKDGFEATWCLLSSTESAEAEVRAELKQQAVDCVLIGGGVKVDPGSFLVFETLINVIHEVAPAAKVCFNTSLDDIAASVRRWL